MLAIVSSLGLPVVACARAPEPAGAGTSLWDNLRTIDNAGGGQIVYGPLPDESSMSGAMVALLRAIHDHFGARPQIRQFFQAKGSSSVATFFTVQSTQGGSASPVSGLVIVSMSQGSKPIGAVLYDTPARFPQTEPAMMETLNAAWRDAATGAPAAGTATGGGGSPGGAVTLRQATAGDRSASIGLPPGWQIGQVGNGQIIANGPNGEFVGLGLVFRNIHDPRAGPIRPGYGGAQPMVAANDGNLYNAFVSIINQSRRNSGMSLATYTLIDSQDLPATAYENQIIHVDFEVDQHDGHGPRKGNARVGAMGQRNAPLWAMSVSMVNAPDAVADADAPVMTAMFKSYSRDESIIGHEFQVAVRQQMNNSIRAGNAANARIQVAHAQSQQSQQAFEQHMDDIDRSSKAFQNYQFDRSELQVTGSGGTARGAVSSASAAALVQYDPTKYSIVDTKDFIKGVDY
jgi:hypothetical protein